VAVLGKGAFDKNIARVNALTKIYDSLPVAIKGRSSVGGADVLRAGVVLLHASLEELLRRVARYRIPDCGEEALKQIPLVGCAPREKFLLSELAQFRGKAVDDVISDSVKHYFDSSVTFNDVTAIVTVLEKCRIKQDRLKGFYPVLAELIARRHHIVHRADVLGPRESKNNVVAIMHRTRPLSVAKVRRWASVTRRFGQGILVEMSGVRAVDLQKHVEYLFG
jgi:hypothetical protein